MGESILEIRHLSKAFGSHAVLRDIDFTVEKGDVISIIGASGSGKSTLLRWWEKKLDGDSSYSLATGDQLAPTAGMLNHPGKGSNFDEQNREFREAIKNRNFSSRGER